MPGSTNLPAGTAEDKRTETVIDRAAPTVSGLAVRLRSIRWKHAFAEVFLIVVGVLTALAVNNWNDERRQRRVEVAMLGQLRAELARDLVVLRAMDDEIRERESRMVALLGDLERGSLPGDASDARFGAVLRIWEPPLSRSVYETLKVRAWTLSPTMVFASALLSFTKTSTSIWIEDRPTIAPWSSIWFGRIT
jgi:hypothetical protein